MNHRHEPAFSFYNPEVQCLSLNRPLSGVELVFNNTLRRERKVAQQIYLLKDAIISFEHIQCSHSLLKAVSSQSKCLGIKFLSQKFSCKAEN